MIRILLVDDDLELCSMQGQYLSNEGFAVQMYHDGESGLEEALSGDYDLILLDVMMPKLNGIEVLRRLRIHSNVPVLMLTAKGDDIDRIIGLELGADDYICKPYSPREVVARVRAVLRRSVGNPPSAPGLDIDEPTMRARLDGRLLDLTAVEFNLLAFLVAHPGRIFNRDQLMERIYSDQRIVNDRTIDSHIKKLRRKMEQVQPGCDLIRSVYSVGYKYEPHGG